MKKNLFGTEVFEKFDEFVLKDKLIQEQKFIEKKLKTLKENQNIINKSPYSSYEDEDGDIIYKVPFEFIGDYDLYNVYKDNKEFNTLIDTYLNHGNGIETEDGAIYWASDVFDTIKYYEKLENIDHLDESKTDKDNHIKNINNELPIGDLEFTPNLYSDEELDEVMAGNKINSYGQRKPIFTVKGTAITEKNEPYSKEDFNYSKSEEDGITFYKIPFIATSIEELIKLSKTDEKLDKFLRKKIGAKDIIETIDGSIYKGSDIFDHILNFNAEHDQIDETLENMKREWASEEDSNEFDDEENNFGEPLPKKKEQDNNSWNSEDMIDELSKKMEKEEAKEIVKVVHELSNKSKSLNETFNRMRYLVNLENYR